MKLTSMFKCWCGWEGIGTVCPTHHSHFYPNGVAPAVCGSSHPEEAPPLDKDGFVEVDGDK